MPGQRLALLLQDLGDLPLRDQVQLGQDLDLFRSVRRGPVSDAICAGVISMFFLRQVSDPHDPLAQLCGERLL